MLLENRSPPGEPAPWWQGPRLAGAALVAAIHVLFVSFLLISLPIQVPPLPTAREMFLMFRPAPKTVRLPRKIEPPGTARAGPPLFHYAPSTAITILPTAKNGLSLSLFGCAPENLANLTPDERAHCGDGLSAASLRADFPGAPHELSLDPGRWAQAIRDRNTPLRVACTSLTKTAGKGPGQSANTLMVDPLCVLSQLSAATDR